MVQNDIKLHNEEVQDILSRPPHNLVRWGSSTIGIIILIFIAGSFFFRYPDVIQANLTITTENPPTWIVARNTGKIKTIYVEDRMVVNQGEVLAVIDNPANTSDILHLKKTLTEFSINDSVINFTFADNSNLGTIQEAYSTFRKAIEEYNNFISLNLFNEKISAKERQLAEYDTYIAHLKEQAELNKRSVLLTQKEFRREEELYKKDLSTLSAYESSEKILIVSKQSYEQLLAAVSNTRITIAQLNNELIELQIQKQQEYAKVKVELQTSYTSLNTAIKEWAQAFLLISPIYGTVSYNDIWKENQNINSGEKIFSVINGDAGMIVGRILFPVEGSGKVRVGQRVNIQLNGYPYMEYGFLTGEIKAISLLSNENKYTAIISIPQNLTTSYNKKIIFKGELLGTAEIITDEKSLGERLMSPFKYIFQKNFQ